MEGVSGAGMSRSRRGAGCVGASQLNAKTYTLSCRLLCCERKSKSITGTHFLCRTLGWVWRWTGNEPAPSGIWEGEPRGPDSTSGWLLHRWVTQGSSEVRGACLPHSGYRKGSWNSDSAQSLKDVGAGKEGDWVGRLPSSGFR